MQLTWPIREIQDVVVVEIPAHFARLMIRQCRVLDAEVLVLGRTWEELECNLSDLRRVIQYRRNYCRLLRYQGMSCGRYLHLAKTSLSRVR